MLSDKRVRWNKATNRAFQHVACRIQLLRGAYFLPVSLRTCPQLAAHMPRKNVVGAEIVGNRLVMCGHSPAGHSCVHLAVVWLWQGCVSNSSSCLVTAFLISERESRGLYSRSTSVHCTLWQEVCRNHL